MKTTQIKPPDVLCWGGGAWTAGHETKQFRSGINIDGHNIKFHLIIMVLNNKLTMKISIIIQKVGINLATHTKDDGERNEYLL